MTTPYVHSNYERRPDDHYPTIDPRCIRALLDTWDQVRYDIVDCCAPNGSGLIDELRRLGHGTPRCTSTVDLTGETDWIVTNPPYVRGIVDDIAQAIIRKIEDRDVIGAALLMRANWDMAARRTELFASHLYAGQTRMRFRPWWSEERKAQPIHNYAWHVWMQGRPHHEPVIRYWPKP